MRSAAESRVEFPSGHKIALAADAPWQLVQDPTPQAPETAAIEPLDTPEIPLPSDDEADGPVSIEVEDGADSRSESTDGVKSESPPDEADTPAPGLP